MNPLRTFVAISFGLICASATFAQGSRHDGIAIGEQGRPVAGASVVVCNQPANITITPCTPLANLFTDATLSTAASNPLTSDGLGNFHFYTAPGVYTLQIYGPGIRAYTTPDVIVPVNPSNAQFDSITATNAISALTLNLGGNLSVGGNASVTGTLTAGSFNANLSVSSNAQTKGYGGMLYVDSTPGGCGGAGCTDSNDGKSIGSAMATVAHAICSLPGGNCATQFVGSGAIYVVNNSNASGSSGCGIWLMGTNDPNYASPPPCWLKTTQGSNGLRIIGISSQTYGPNGQAPAAAINGGSNVDRSHPLIWISALNGSVEIDNVADGSGNPQRALVIGECSNGTRTTTCNSSSVVLNNDHFSIPAVAGYGPTCDITGGSFWIRINQSGCQGSDTANPPTSDNASALLIDGRGSAGVDLIFIEDFETLIGGIKYYQGGVGGFSVKNLTSEGLNGEPAIEFASGGNGTDAVIEKATVADPVVNAPAVENDMGPGTGRDIIVSDAMGQGPNTVGPMTVLSQYTDNLSGQSASPLKAGQSGFIGGWVYGKRDDVQRAAALTRVRFANVVAGSTCSSWQAVFATGAALTCSSIADPFGGTNAGEASATGGPGGALQFLAGSSGVQNHNFAVGDYIIAGVWVRSKNANGFPGTPTVAAVVAIGGAGFSASGSCDGDSVIGDSEWTWDRCIYKITAVGTNPGILQFYAQFDSTHTIDAYGPVLNYIPAGTLSDDEAYAYENSLVTYDTHCSLGAACGTEFNPPQLFAPIVDSPAGASGVTFRNAGSTVWTANASSSALSFNYNAHLGETAVKLAPFGGQSSAGLVDNFGMTAGFVSVAESGGTASFDAGLGNTFELTLSANATSTTLSNAQPGQWLNFIICQPASGGPFTFAWPSSIHGGMTIGTTAGKCSVQSFVFDGSSAFATSSGVANE
jgi:hypothetical protein